MHLTSTFLLAALLPLSALAGWVFDPSNPGDGSCDAVCASPDNGGGKCAQEGFAFFSVVDLTVDLTVQCCVSIQCILYGPDVQYVDVLAVLI